MTGKEKLAYLFQHPQILEAIEQYDKHRRICKQCFNELQNADDNSEHYYEHYWANWFHSQQEANKLVTQHNLSQFGRHPITKQPRDD